MYQCLKKNQEIILDNGSKCKVIDFIGSGGQGEVYKVNCEGQDYALKWYFTQNSNKTQKKIIKKLTQIESPSDNFLWPIAFGDGDDNSLKSFGYLMKLRPSNFSGINDLLNRKVEPTFRALITACFNLADSYFQLHSRGLAYKDISDQNVFFDHKTGRVLICDNDNATYDGTEISSVGGTPRYMAPEIVKGEENPSKYTDLYSLSVLMFLMLYLNHPLDGLNESKIHALDLPAMNKLYGYNPIFIFDPINKENRPDPERHENALIFWELYPKFINDLFTQVFTKGLTDFENGRVLESVWRKAMIKLRDSIIYCPSCGSEIFYDNSKVQEGKNVKCWNGQCGSNVKLPFRIKIEDKVVMLNHDTKLFPHHTKGKNYDFNEATAEVVIHPTKKIWGLKNLTSENWTLTNSDNKTIEIQPGKTVTLANNYKINFGVCIGIVRFN